MCEEYSCGELHPGRLQRGGDKVCSHRMWRWRPIEQVPPIHFLWHTREWLRRALWDSMQRRTNYRCRKKGGVKSWKSQFYANIGEMCLAPLQYCPEKLTRIKQCSGGLVFTCWQYMSVEAKTIIVLSGIPLFYVPGLQDYKYKQTKCYLAQCLVSSWRICRLFLYTMIASEQATRKLVNIDAHSDEWEVAVVNVGRFVNFQWVFTVRLILDTERLHTKSMERCEWTQVNTRRASL